MALIPNYCLSVKIPSLNTGLLNNEYNLHKKDVILRPADHCPQLQTMTITVGGAALNQTPIDWENNKQNIIYAIEYARIEGVELLCLPELCICGYGCEDLFLSDWLYETALQKLLEVRHYCYDISVAIGLPLKYNGQHFNTTCFIENTEIKGFYAKQHLANDGIHYETRWFTAWEAGKTAPIQIEEQEVPLGDTLFEWKGNQIGFEICEDAWRSASRPGISFCNRGANILLNPSASHFAFGKTKLREKLVTGSSETFDCLYVYANLLGNESGRIIYDGEILIAHKGQLLARNKLLSFQAFNLCKAEVDLYEPNTILPEESWIAPFEDKNEEFTAAISLALFDYMRKSRSKGYIISLSGGADSACCAVLVAEMVKRGCTELKLAYFLKRAGLDADTCTYATDKSLVTLLLTCAYQGTKNSSETTFNAAKRLANSIQAVFYHWSIDEVVTAYTSKIQTAVGRDLSWTTDDLTLQNIQARSRSPAIWMLANLKNALLITTSNRSEGDVGYTTMDGDTSGSIAPIAGVDKYFIQQWLIWAEKKLGYLDLVFINEQEPTAELRPSDKKQTDESELMPYSLLDKIELLAIRQRLSPIQVYLTLKNQVDTEDVLLKSYVKKFFRLWARNQWKRERFAPSFHIDDHNVDPRTWCRFPILSGGYEEELLKF